MKFGYKHDKVSETLLRRFSIRTKIIIFCILSVIVAGIAYEARIDNTNMVNKETPVKNSNSTASNGAVIKSAETDQKQQVQTITEQEDKSNKILEDKYQQSTQAFSQKKYEETINIANEILKEDENSYKAYNIKGIALCYNKEYEEGMKNIDEALQLKPDFGYARFNKALAYELYGHYDEALAWYDKDLEIENYIWSYYGKASIYGRRGDVENTTKYLKIAIQMSPDVKELAREEADFGPVKDSKEFQDLIR